MVEGSRTCHSLIKTKSEKFLPGKDPERQAAGCQLNQLLADADNGARSLIPDAHKEIRKLEREFRGFCQSKTKGETKTK